MIIFLLISLKYTIYLYVQAIFVNIYIPFFLCFSGQKINKIKNSLALFSLTRQQLIFGKKRINSKKI